MRLGRVVRACAREIGVVARLLAAWNETAAKAPTVSEYMRIDAVRQDDDAPAP